MSVWFWMSKVEFQAKPDYLRYIDVVEQESSNTDIDANDKQDKAQDEAKASPLARWILSLHLTPFVLVDYLCLILSWLNKQESSSNSESCEICKLQRGIIAHLLLKFGNWNLETCQRMRIIYHLVLYFKRIMWGRIVAWFSIHYFVMDSLFIYLWIWPKHLTPIQMHILSYGIKYYITKAFHWI